MKYREPITLGELIEQLKKHDRKLDLKFNFGRAIPTEIRSWRGDYAKLAIGYAFEGEITVGEFLDKCQAILGTTQEGYKGGDYLMTSATSVYVENYGEYSDPSTVVTKVVGDEYRVFIKTKQTC